MIRGLHVREVWEDDLKKVKEEVAKLFLNRFLEGEDGAACYASAFSVVADPST